jgi:hypothetical protein
VRKKLIAVEIVKEGNIRQRSMAQTKKNERKERLVEETDINRAKKEKGTKEGNYKKGTRLKIMLERSKGGDRQIRSKQLG